MCVQGSELVIRPALYRVENLGVSLLAFSVTGAFLTPSLPLEDVPGGSFAGLVQAAVGIWLVTGVRLCGAGRSRTTCGDSVTGRSYS